MTICQITEEIRRQLAGQYPATEIESFIRILFGYYLNMNPLQIYLSHGHELPAGVEPQIRAATGDLKKFRPIQYIIGETEFCGLKFEVTPDVLIPRPETEELTDWILHEYDKSAALSIVDVCTGSGCIAVALAAGFRNAGVWAVDISEAALAVARRNALKNRVKVEFLQRDVLQDDLTDFEPASLDMIVSNPPYVTLPEKRQIQPNVLEYEPYQALFAPGHDPFIFYKRIAAFGMKCLKPHGKVFFELNEAFPEEVAQVLQQNGYSDIVTRKDINGKWRMIFAKK